MVRGQTSQSFICCVALRHHLSTLRRDCGHLQPMHILALIVDFKTPDQARNLSIQLKAQNKQRPFHVSVVHVDNGNTPAVVLSPEQIEAGVELVRLNSNLGYGGAINAAIASFLKNGKTYDSYLILNSDLDLNDPFLEKLTQVLEENPKAGLVGPRIFKGKSSQIWGTRGEISPILGITAMSDWTQKGPLPERSYVPGAAFLVRASAFHEVGGLPEDYFLYFEETEFCLKLQRSGHELWIEPSAEAYHHVNSFHEGIPSPHFAYYFSRNNLLFWKKNFGIPWFFQLPRTVIVVFKEVVLPLRCQRLSDSWPILKLSMKGLRDGFKLVWNRKQN